MSDETTSNGLLPPRKVIYSTYNGPRKGLAAATKHVYGWVGTYYKDQVSDVVVCFDERPTPEGSGDPNLFINIEVRFDLDDNFSMNTKLPPDLEVKEVPGESILCHTYAGPMTGLMKDIVPWLTETATAHDVRPGFRQRMVTMKQKPNDPGWEVEVQLVLR